MLRMSELPYHMGFIVKLYPSNEQKRLIAVNDGAKRAVYNHLVARSNERYLLSKTAAFVPCYQDRLAYVKSVTGAVKNIQNAMPFLYGKDVDAQTIANAVKNYKTAWKNQKERHTGAPTFKKKSYEQSYQTNAHYYANKDGEIVSNARFEDKEHVVLPKLGRIRMGASPKLVEKFLKRNDIRIGTITISRDAVGEYWASFSLGSEKPFHEPLPKTGKQHGIDLNLVELINDSDGETSENMRFYQRTQQQLAKQQRRLSRRHERAKKENRELRNAKNYQKQRKKVASMHRRISRQREDYLHNLSKHEVENQDLIAAEDLQVKNLIKNHHLAKSIADAGWRKLLTMLQYKAAFYGKTVVLVPPQNTTQTCSVCGYVMKGEQHLTLKDREWECPNCHMLHKRDTNAAQNVLKRAL